MLTLEPFSEDQGRSAVHPARGIPPISFLAPCGFTHPLTRTHVRLLGPCFKTGRMGCPQAGAGSTQVYRRDGACCQPRSTRRHLHEPIDSSGFGRRTNPHRSTPRVDRRTGYRRSTSDRDASPAPIRFPPDNFKHSLTLFSKSFSSFPRAPRGATGSGHDGALTLSGAPFQGTWARSAAEDASPDYNSDSEAVRFSSWADPGSLAVTKGILVHVHGSFCFAGFDNDPSAGSPTETLLRLLLPLNDKVQWNSRDVAGGEPPTPVIASNFRGLKGHSPSKKLAVEGYLHIATGITAAAGTRLALQWILVKGFRLYSFQLPDSFEPGIVIYCHYLPVSGLGNLRALLPSLDVVAVSQAPSPESNPNSPSPVTTIVGHYPTIES
ncbi:hypothetical protein L1887_46911 [Cichorium endivia]|nr:hypothetical protein L1887_61936 [Cichorium endivia]KAI3477627.1 hypothetical protein L1887_60604 [Cichorium endivia]KAI3488987.1 hypothetical protein L1887_46911 [Cichorium endivia]